MNFDKWAEEVSSFLRLTGQVNPPTHIPLDLMERFSQKGCLEDRVKHISNRCSSTFREVHFTSVLGLW